MDTKSNSLAVFVKEKYDTVFELSYQGRSKQYAQRRMRELRGEGLRVVGCEVRCSARGKLTLKELR